MNLVTN